MAKVYVIQENNLDFSAAEDHGSIVFLSVDRRDDFHNVANSEHNRSLMAQLRRQLRNYDVQEDWLVITGSPYVCAAVFALLGSMGYKRLRILRWDNRDLRYLPLTLQLDQETTDDEEGHDSQG